jgi:hypothetical protein
MNGLRSITTLIQVPALVPQTFRFHLQLFLTSHQAYVFSIDISLDLYHLVTDIIHLCVAFRLVLRRYWRGKERRKIGS